MDISVPIVGFIFVCIIYPHLVKSKPQFYMAFAVVLVILALNVVGGTMSADTHLLLKEEGIADLTVAEGGLRRLIHLLVGVLWIVDFILLVLATGGLSLHDLSGELGNAFEVMRRGEDTKTVIVPLTGEQPKPRDQAAAERAAARASTRVSPPREEGSRSIPMD